MFVPQCQGVLEMSQEWDRQVDNTMPQYKGDVFYTVLYRAVPLECVRVRSRVGHRGPDATVLMQLLSNLKEV